MSEPDRSGGHDTVDQILRIDELCDRYEDELRLGRRPTVEAFLLAAGLAAPNAAPGLVRELVRLEAEYRGRAGLPVPPPEEYARRFPQLVGETVSLSDPSGDEADTAPEPRANGHFAPEPSIPGYEILGELGRGGMGIIYKARHVLLNRFVAVKMIRAGELARPDDIRRFRAEAEIVANFDHPNILPVYDTGEFYGRQFFSMKLVAGGCLATRISSFSGKHEDIARLVAALARAAECAHRSGLIHRDLKPANVLIDTDGSPYVTDFGLAKLAGADDGFTKSGVIIGTPSYMAPEQARCERTLTAAVDIYALGAILYELITARPPFQGPTALDTVVEVLEREPVHPRTLNPAADRDLSLIALKCLEKDPGRRYPTAAALAEDLERRLAGEPVTARRRPVLQRLLAWAWREPGLACRLMVIGLSAVIVRAKYQWSPLVGPDEHVQIMSVLAVWAVLAVACQSLLRRDRFSATVVATWVAADVALMTVLMILDVSHETPLIVGYGLIVAMSGVWLRVGLVWFATAAAVTGYTVLMAHAAAHGRLTTHVHHHVIAGIALVAIGAVVGYQVRRARLLSRFRAISSGRAS